MNNKILYLMLAFIGVILVSGFVQASVSELGPINLTGNITGNTGNENITNIYNISTSNLVTTNLEGNMDGTGYNVTVECILFTSGGKICDSP